MNRVQHSTDYVRLESNVVAHLEALFMRCPALHGFSVQPGEQLESERIAHGLYDGLYLADVVSHWPLSREQAATLIDEVSQALCDLVDEQPEATALLRGRTFARILH